MGLRQAGFTQGASYVLVSSLAIQRTLTTQPEVGVPQDASRVPARCVVTSDSAHTDHSSSSLCDLSSTATMQYSLTTQMQGLHEMRHALGFCNSVGASNDTGSMDLCRSERH